MKLRCVGCGHSLDLEDGYDDFSGVIRCYVCGALTRVKISNGEIRSADLAAGSEACCKETVPTKTP